MRRRSQSRRADQECADPAEPQLSKGSRRGRDHRRQDFLRGPRKGNRRRHGAGLRQRVFRAGTEGPPHLLQVAARPEAADLGTPRHPVQHVLHEPVGDDVRHAVDGEFRNEMKKRNKPLCF